MPQVTVRFFDDETMNGECGELSFDEPDFVLDVQDQSGLDNNETAWIPLSSVKWVDLPFTGPEAVPSRKVAIRFMDGEVLRGHVDGGVVRHRYGLVLDLYPERGDARQAVRRYGIPFTAIKAMFYVREFDGRETEEAGAASDAYLTRRTIAPLLDVLEEMDMIRRLHEQGVLDLQEYEEKRTQVLERL
ncbi:MAG TPA: hypothetical protein VNI34_02365 [Candidatus Nitrosotalea sp.]|nr:hypothetical protein [Candidatus Nitrosotalea sp.]